MQQLGHASLADFFAANAGSSLQQLARILPGRVPPIQLQAFLLSEAGDMDAGEWAARELLARRVLGMLPDGWRVSAVKEFRYSHLWAVWVAAFPESCGQACETAWSRLVSSAFDSWLPASGDDSLLVEAFGDLEFPLDRWA